MEMSNFFSTYLLENLVLSRYMRKSFLRIANIPLTNSKSKCVNLYFCVAPDLSSNSPIPNAYGYCFLV